MTSPPPRPIILSVARAAIACRRRPKGNPTFDQQAQDVVRRMTARSPADFLAGVSLPIRIRRALWGKSGIHHERRRYRQSGDPIRRTSISRVRYHSWKWCSLSALNPRNSTDERATRAQSAKATSLTNKNCIRTTSCLFRHVSFLDASSSSDTTRRRPPWRQSKK